MMSILDDHELPISSASLQYGADLRTVVLAGVNQRALMTYYFVRGRRCVVIDLGEVLLRGRLETKWDGTQRCWSVRIDTPVLVPAAICAPRDETHEAVPRSRALAIAS